MKRMIAQLLDGRIIEKIVSKNITITEVDGSSIYPDIIPVTDSRAFMVEVYKYKDTDISFCKLIRNDNDGEHCLDSYGLIERLYSKYPNENKIKSQCAFEQEFVIYGDGINCGEGYLGSNYSKVSDFLSAVKVLTDRHSIDLLSFHAEVSPRQFEITPRHTDTLTALRNDIVLKYILKFAADKLGLRINFESKTSSKQNGSGKHLHYSFDDFKLILDEFIAGLYIYSVELISTFMHGTNLKRLSSNEAPPPYITINTSEQRNRTSPVVLLNDHLEFRSLGADQDGGMFLYVLEHLLLKIREGHYYGSELGNIVFNGNCYLDEYKEFIKEKNLINTYEPLSFTNLGLSQFESNLWVNIIRQGRK
jgi:glutamine synthetase